MFRLFALTAILAVVAADPLRSEPRANSDSRIIGGEETTIEEAPHQVSLQLYEDHWCGGSIISDTWILTAGHCVDHSPEVFSVRAGSSGHTQGGSIHQVVEIIRHSGYASDKYHRPIKDIALVRVAEPFVFDETRRAIELPGMDDVSPAGVMATITGWGSTTKGEPVVLETVQVPIISKEDCYQQYAKLEGIYDGEICAAYPEGGKDACHGDSGGPLTINGRLAGIISWGYDCAEPGYPGVYAEVAAYRAWIRANADV